jgi:hypothetical protein
MDPIVGTSPKAGKLAARFEQKEGACLSLVGDWLREKIRGTNGFAQKVSRRFGRENRRFQVLSPDIIQQESQKAQDEYLKNGRAETDRLKNAREQGEVSLSDEAFREAVVRLEARLFESLLENKGLRINRGLSDTANRDLITEDRGSVSEIMSRVTAKTYLTPGHGLLITIGYTSGGSHTVGVYRSNGDTLYFFDPNWGIYVIDRRMLFFDKWESGHGSTNSGKLVFRITDPFCFVG